MVSSFAVKGDGIQKEQHKVALGLENFKPLAFRIVKSTLRRLFSLLVLSFLEGSGANPFTQYRVTELLRSGIKQTCANSSNHAARKGK